MMYRKFYPGSWNEMERLQSEMNRLFEAASYPSRRTRPAGGYPAMNVWSNEEQMLVSAELPGIETKDIDISVAGDMLTISGSRSAEEVDDSVRQHRQERICGKFSRSIQLPYEVESDKVEARLEKGVLTVKLPRAEAQKPRKIVVHNN